MHIKHKWLDSQKTNRNHQTIFLEISNAHLVWLLPFFFDRTSVLIFWVLQTLTLSNLPLRLGSVHLVLTISILFLFNL